MFKDKPAYVRDGAIALGVLVLISAIYFIFRKPSTPAVVGTDSSRQEGTSPADANVAEVPLSPPITRADILSAFSRDGAAVSRTDVFFKNPGSADPQLLLRARSTAVRAAIESLRAEISQTLKAWQDLTRTVAETSVVDPNSAALARQYADDVRDYVADLKNIVDGLTPGNSGLTQAEIDADQTVVDQVITDVNDVATSIGATGLGTGATDNNGSNGGANGTDNSGGNNSGSNTDDNGSQNSGSNGNDDQVAPPPPPPPPPPPYTVPEDSGPIHLIEGANPIR